MILGNLRLCRNSSTHAPNKTKISCVIPAGKPFVDCVATPIPCLLRREPSAQGTNWAGLEAWPVPLTGAGSRYGNANEHVQAGHPRRPTADWTLVQFLQQCHGRNHCRGRL